MLTLAVMCFTLLVVAAPARSSSWPTSREALRWRWPHGWLAGALCIHRHESVDWHRRWVDWAGRPSSYAGGMQFLQSTWERAGGRGEPWQWSPREQLYRSFVIWRMHHGSWSEWGTAGECGLDG